MNKYGCKVLTGEEFERAAAQATPLSKIKAPFSKNIPRPHGDMPSGIGRRHESPTKPWGSK